MVSNREKLGPSVIPSEMGESGESGDRWGWMVMSRGFAEVGCSMERVRDSPGVVLLMLETNLDMACWDANPDGDVVEDSD